MRLPNKRVIITGFSGGGAVTVAVATVLRTATMLCASVPTTVTSSTAVNAPTASTACARCPMASPARASGPT